MKIQCILARASRLGCALVLLANGALANANEQPSVQTSSLEVKARIASMEQVNVTAEKPVDETASLPSAAVAELLLQLDALQAEEVLDRNAGTAVSRSAD